MKAVLIGAGGHARVVLEAARAQGLEVVAIIDDKPNLKGTMIDSVPIVGAEDELDRLHVHGVDSAILGVGSIEATTRRQYLYERLAAKWFSFPVVQHPSSVVAHSVRLGPATVVLAGAIINPSASIGCNVIVNTASLIEHDCIVEDHVHVSPGALLAGGARIGTRSHVGIGAVVIQGVQIGADVTIGAGAVVLRDVATGLRVAGVPARVLPEKAD